MTPEIEIERPLGFVNAEGNNGVSYASANQAFYGYLAANGLPKTKENKGKFKAWLAKAKESGVLDKITNATRETGVDLLNKKRNQLSERIGEMPPPVDDQPKQDSSIKILGMKPFVALGVTVAVIGLVSVAIYAITKKSKTAS
jgi:hypothetical protein